jgi:rhamnogalacturonyl hydrolase YesR
MTRVIRTLPEKVVEEQRTLIAWVREGMDACLAYMRNDGLFHDVIDDPSTFVETTWPRC